MATRPQGPAPFIAPLSGTLDQRLAQVAQAINRKADTATVPVFTAVIFVATDGSRWQFSISPAGAAVITQVT